MPTVTFSKSRRGRTRSRSWSRATSSTPSLKDLLDRLRERFPGGVDIVPASALDRHSFTTLRPVVLILDATPDAALLRAHYGDITPEPLAPGYALLPPLDPYADLASLGTVMRIAERLRALNGCPWDRRQTHETLRPFLLEESYEALEALDTGDRTKLRDELGDLLLQIALHAQLAHEDGAFDIADVTQRLNAKLIRRHPHVFAGTAIKDDLLAQWERIKRDEREAEGKKDDGLLGGIPKGLPALFAAERLQERGERVGLRHERVDLPLDIDDESFLGELLFDLVAAAREKGFDAETALREANERFSRRVAKLEERARREGRALESYAPADMRRMWEETT